MKSAKLSARFKSLFIDYIVIVCYGLTLAAVTTGGYYYVYGGVPAFTATASQFIAFFTMIFPVFLYFVATETGTYRASLGKRKSKIHIQYKGGLVTSAVIRNGIKLLPWQLGHMAVIEGVFNGFNTYFVAVTYGLAVILPIIYIVMVFIRKDHRSVPDLLANTVVVGSEQT